MSVCVYVYEGERQREGEGAQYEVAYLSVLEWIFHSRENKLKLRVSDLFAVFLFDAYSILRSAFSVR